MNNNNPKRLYKVRNGKMICGVCLGLAEYFDLDPSIVRIGTVVLSCFVGTGILAYIVAAIILPEKEDLG